jgi:DNA (cytosine-5)-methyltransferase 1
MRLPTVIDLFCGAGGFSLGACQAGFKVVASVDADETLTSSYKNNFPNSKLLIADISKLSTDTLLRNAGTSSSTVIDGIIGGPPCQGFSTIGKRNKSDPRNTLLIHFFRIVAGIRPKFFVMENVPGLVAKTADDIIGKAISNLKGYQVIGPLCVDANDLGAPTRRKRIVVIGYDPTQVGGITEADVRSLYVLKKTTVREAIADLPEPSVEPIAPYRTLRALSEYARRSRALPTDGVGSSAARIRTLSERVSGLQITLHTSQVLERFKQVAPGRTDEVSRCVRLSWDKAAPTLRAGTGPERGSFQSVRPIHPSRPRVITVREAARLQGFPDWFDFHQTKWHSFRMIGNSVSPIMAEALLRLIAKRLKH